MAVIYHTVIATLQSGQRSGVFVFMIEETLGHAKDFRSGQNLSTLIKPSAFPAFLGNYT